MDKFDYKKFAEDMAEQAKALIPKDISEQNKEYIIETLKRITYIAGEALDQSPEKYTTEQKYFYTQLVTEWIFHKSVDLGHSDIALEYWDTILQKIAFVAFEIEKQAYQKKLEQDVLLNCVEHHVNKAYKEELDKLFEKGCISEDVYQKALQESNIDKMVSERNDMQNEVDLTADVKKENDRFITKLKGIKFDFGFIKDFFLKIKTFVIDCFNLKIKFYKYILILMTFLGFKYFTPEIDAFLAQQNISFSKVEFAFYVVLLLITIKCIINTINACVDANMQKHLDEMEAIRNRLSDLVNPDKQFERLGVDVLCLQIGQGLLQIVDPDLNGTLLAKVCAIRQNLTDTLGYVIPNIRIMDSSELDIYEYSISVRGNKVAGGFVYPYKYMVIADEWEEKGYEIPEKHIVGVDPIWNTQCYWLEKEDITGKDDITVNEPVHVITTHIKELTIKYVDSILSTTDIKKYLASARSVMDCYERISTEDVRKIFVNLIKEGISIKDLTLIFDRLNDYTRFYTDADRLSEMLRKDLAQQICLKHSHDNTIYAIKLPQNWRITLEHSLEFGEESNAFYLTENQKEELLEKIAVNLMKAHQETGHQAVVICQSKIRLPLYRFLISRIPSIVVLSESELLPEFKIEDLSNVED